MAPAMTTDDVPVVIINPHLFSVVVASKSPIKLACVRRFYKDTHPNVEVIGVDTETSFPQPLGIEQAEQCVDERLACAEQFACDNTELLIALENYVYVEPTDETHRDACLLAVRRAGCDTQFGRLPSTTSVVVPETLKTVLDEQFASSEPYLDVTCGALLRPRFGTHPEFWENDWFLATGAPFSRSTQIDMVLQANSALLNVAPQLHPNDAVSAAADE
jgi:non-canonical (house-cleaning) NTP pyrophosphatase